MTLGERIKLVRKTNKLNQKNFAAMLGISQTHVSKIEKGVENPSETLLLFMSYKFAVNIDWLKTEQGNYTIDFNSSDLDRLVYVRYKAEQNVLKMNHSCSWEYSNIFFYLEKLLDCFNPMDGPKSEAYYKNIRGLISHLMIPTVFNNTTRNISEIKKMIDKDVEDIIEAYKKNL